MVQKGIVLGHIVSKKGLEVDQAKVDLIKNLPEPKTVKDIRSFLGHAGFYRKFIEDFSKIARPLTNLLVLFKFDESCREAFNNIKTHLITAPKFKH